jgi:hypothetical protein
MTKPYKFALSTVLFLKKKKEEKMHRTMLRNELTIMER